MDAILTVGKFSHVEKVAKIFANPKRKETNKVIKPLDSPFKNPKFKPSHSKISKINHNFSNLSFKIGNKKQKKSILFYHMFNKELKGKLNVI